MKPCWKDGGLTEDGARAADSLIDRALALVEASPTKEVAQVVWNEALFRTFVLPHRTKGFQKLYRRRNR